MTHLLFADDSSLFWRAKNTDCNKLLEVLEHYEKASGQVVDVDKSGILFSANTSREDKESSMKTLNIYRPLDGDSLK